MECNIEQSRITYGIRGWSSGYFDIDDTTHSLVIYPHRTPEKGRIALQDILQATTNSGLQYPLLIRFLDIIKDRVQSMTQSFDQAINAAGILHAQYRPMYPVKVNQQCDVVEAVLAAGAGLEVGTKAELMAALFYVDHAEYRHNLTIICNGYKDQEYIRLALIARALGVHIIIVIEKLAEYSLLCTEAGDIIPGEDKNLLLGVRIRLSSVAAGRWQNSGGEKSKFGLSSGDLLVFMQALKKQGHSLTLLHAHMGSQIANLQDINNGIHELMRFYCELHRAGLPVSILDVGGGLGVDYEGTATCGDFSMNYTLAEYAETVINGISAVLSETDIPFPIIFNEPGRALTAHHAILVTDIVNTEQPSNTQQSQIKTHKQSMPECISRMQRTYETRETCALHDTYDEIKKGFSTSQEAFSSGKQSLFWQAYAEEIYQKTCAYLLSKIDIKNTQRDEIFCQLKAQQADKYFCNFSLFQSLPDVWGLSQIFPIMPLNNLHEPAERFGVIVDLTCDSDGRIDRYSGAAPGNVLPLSSRNTKKGALIGMFLIGAYQETLGDMHNLFGRPDAVNVVLDQENSGHLYHIKKGEAVRDVLATVSYDTKKLQQAYQFHSSHLEKKKKEAYLKELLTTLDGSTYLS